VFTTETGAASYRVTGRDVDDDKTQHASQTREEEQAHTRYRSGTIGRATQGARREPSDTKGRSRAERGAQGVKTKRGRGDIGSQ
jgi:hypothetical protein